MSYLLQQNGFKLLLQDGGGILLAPANSRMSKIIAWKKCEYKVKVKVDKCVKCRTADVKQGFVLCESCSRIPMQKVSIPFPPPSAAFKWSKPPLTTKKIADLYVKIGEKDKKPS